MVGGAREERRVVVAGGTGAVDRMMQLEEKRAWNDERR
jgi:hypothetical protein